MPIEDNYNPSIHRINLAVKWRAVHPEQPIPKPPAMLLRFISPPEDLIAKVQGKIDHLIQNAGVKKGKDFVKNVLPEAI